MGSWLLFSKITNACFTSIKFTLFMSGSLDVDLSGDTASLSLFPRPAYWDDVQHFDELQFSKSNHCRKDAVLFYNGCDTAKKEGCHHRLGLMSIKLHMWVNRMLTCHCLCWYPQWENCESPQSHRLCKLRQNKMDTTTLSRRCSSNKDCEMNYTE